MITFYICCLQTQLALMSYFVVQSNGNGLNNCVVCIEVSNNAPNRDDPLYISKHIQRIMATATHKRLSIDNLMYMTLFYSN